MASDVKVQVAGIHSSNNPFSSAPPGGLARADNCVLNATNVLEPRRGFAAMDYAFGISSDRANVLAYFGTYLLVQYGTSLAYDTGAAFSTHSGTYTPVDSTVARMRFVPAASNLYFNCNDGTRVLTSAAGTPTQAGVPKALRTYVYNRTGQGWHTYNTAVRYRALWGIVDANGNEKLGVPSGPAVLANRILVAVGSITRTAPDGSHAAGKVTVSTLSSLEPHWLNVGDTVTLSPGEANFAAGVKTVVTVTSAWGFTYNEAGANVSSTLEQDFQATRSATVLLNIPSGITTSHFFRVYRSDESATAATAPFDELYLVYEGQPSAGDITAGFVEVNDITPSDFIINNADPLYTNANSGGGAAVANERPPVGLDMTEWDGCVWWANTKQRHRMEIQLLGVGTPSGIQAADTITIGGQTYTWNGGGSNPSIWTVGATPSINIDKSARNLCQAVNGNASSTVYAHYLSGEDDNPGRILLEERAIGGSAFTVSTSRVLSWNPALSRTSDNNAQPHGLMYSKPGQPEAVPLVNEVLVGSKNSPIRRVCPLKGSLLVFKTDGIWTVTGTNGRYSVEQVAVAKLLAPETVCLFSDAVWALTDQGVLKVTDGGGVSVVSYSIETSITSLFGSSTLSALKLRSFAVGYESDRRFLCWMPTAQGDTYGTQAFNHSTGTKTWTRWTKAAQCAVVDPNTDKLVIAGATSNTVSVERKAFSYLDYADESFSVTISSLSGTTVTLNTGSHGVLVGDCINSGGFSIGSPPESRVIVTAVNGAALTIPAEGAAYLPSSGAVTVYPGIACRATWLPVTLGAPTQTKTHRRLTFLTDGIGASQADAVFTSDGDATEDSVDLEVGTLPLIGSASTVKLVPVAPLPMDHSACAQLSVGFSVREALAPWKLHGFVAEADAESERGRR